jgi:hypothetical protein
VQWTVPPVPVAVPVYVVVVDGVTDFEPPATGVTEPIELLIVKEVACVVVHESAAESPVVIEVGEAVRVHVGGGGVTVTVTVVLQWTVPPVPVAVPV